MSDDPNLYESDTSNRCGEPLAYGDAVSVCNQTKGHGGEWHGRWSHTGIVIKRWPVAFHPVWCVHEPPYCMTVAECHMRRRSDPVGSAAGSARPISAREAARRRLRLDGADAQALEHALTITERERDALKADLAEAEAHHVEHHERENARGVAAIVAYVRSNGYDVQSIHVAPDLMTKLEAIPRGDAQKDGMPWTYGVAILSDRFLAPGDGYAILRNGQVRRLFGRRPTAAQTKEGT